MSCIEIFYKKINLKNQLKKIKLPLQSFPLLYGCLQICKEHHNAAVVQRIQCT